ncbi:MAG: ABC transporter ATP-binding protein, partial [Patescibacteria group bacterium]
MKKTFKKFYKYLLIRKWWFALSVVLITLGVFMDFLTPYFFKLFVEKIQNSDYQAFITILLIFLGVKFVDNIISNMRYFTGDIAEVDGAIALRSDVFKKIQDLDFAYHTNKSTGFLISVFKRGDNAFWGLGEKIHRKLYVVAVSFIIIIFYFANIDTRIIVVFIISFLSALFVARFILPKNIKTRVDFNAQEDHIAAIIGDNMINYETVKLFAKEDWEQKRLKETFKTWKGYVWKHFMTYRYIDFSLAAVIGISTCIVLYISLNLVRSQAIAISDFVLIISAISLFFPKLFDLVYSMRNLSQDYTDFKKYADILDLEVQIKDPEREVKLMGVNGSIKFKNVSFSYKEGKARAVKDINLEVKPGESVALVGRSGVGKTTLVRLLMRFFDVDKGEITIDDVNIKDFSKSRLRSFMGVVPQEPILFNNTIGYNIAYGADDPSKEAIRAAAKMANLDKFIEGLPEKYETHVGERGIKLSGGQRQRIAIARALLKKAPILVLDEATSSLDSESEKYIQEGLWELMKDKTAL